MNKLLIFTLLVFGYNQSFSQTYGIYFFGDKYKNYKGLNAKLDLERGGTYITSSKISKNIEIVKNIK